LTEPKIIADNREGRGYDLDINFKDGGLELIADSEGAYKQRGYVAAYLKYGTMPLYPTSGVQWALFLIGEITWSELVPQIQQRLNDCCGTGRFMPYLSQTDKEVHFNLVDLVGKP
jgi:hypothetical protein